MAQTSRSPLRTVPSPSEQGQLPEAENRQRCGAGERDREEAEEEERREREGGRRGGEEGEMGKKKGEGESMYCLFLADSGQGTEPFIHS